MMSQHEAGVNPPPGTPFTLIEQLYGLEGRAVTAKPTRGEAIIGTLLAVTHDAIVIEGGDGSVTTCFRWALAFVRVAPAGAR